MKMKTKTGEKITIKEFMKRWKEGIENITPQQRLSNEKNSTLIMLIGYLVGFISLIVFRDSFVVSWFAYGLMLIFLGSVWSQGVKFLALRQQLKIFKNMDNQSMDFSKLLEGLIPIEEEIDNNLLKGGKDNEQN